MKKLLIYIMILLLFQSCMIKSNSSCQPNIDSIWSQIVSNRQTWLNSWSDTLELDYFKISSVNSIQFSDFSDFVADSTFFYLYKNLIYFNQDSNLIIDIYSYNTSLVAKDSQIVCDGFDVDTKGVLIDLKNKKNYQLFFYGSSVICNDILWINNTKFILMGSNFRENENNEDCYYPFFRIYDFSSATYYEYSYSNFFACNETFFQKRFPFIKIDF